LGYQEESKHAKYDGRSKSQILVLDVEGVDWGEIRICAIVLDFQNKGNYTSMVVESWSLTLV
jgi:hypothetical protein